MGRAKARPSDFSLGLRRHHQLVAFERDALNVLPEFRAELVLSPIIQVLIKGEIDQELTFERRKLGIRSHRPWRIPN